MKRIKKVLLLSTLLLLLVGCAKIRMRVEIVNEEELKSDVTILFEESTYDLLFGDNELSEQELMDSMGTENIDAEMTLISETIDGKKYKGYTMTPTDPESGEDSLLNNISVTTENGKEVYTLQLTSDALSNDQMDLSELEEYGYSTDQMRTSGMEMTMEIVMPYAITEADIGTVNGNTLTIDLLEIMEANNLHSFTIVAKESAGSGHTSSTNTTLLYGGIALLIVAIAGIGYFMWQKKKEQNIEASDTVE